MHFNCYLMTSFNTLKTSSDVITCHDVLLYVCDSFVMMTSTLQMNKLNVDICYALTNTPVKALGTLT